jgi:hypothetical protein
MDHLANEHDIAKDSKHGVGSKRDRKVRKKKSGLRRPSLSWGFMRLCRGMLGNSTIHALTYTKIQKVGPPAPASLAMSLTLHPARHHLVQNV